MTTLEERARRAGLHGLLARWDEVGGAPWLEPVIESEERERAARSLQRRSAAARLPPFKPMADFDWDWPGRIDRRAVQELCGLGFVERAADAVIVGPQGTGKTMIAANVAHQAVLNGYTARFENAPELLSSLAAIDSAARLKQRLTLVARPQLLVLDEIGYLTHDSRHADLLFHIVSRRHQRRSTLVTTTRAFGEWDRVFPNAGSVVGLVDRLVFNATVVAIHGQSWRLGHSAAGGAAARG